jgi:hypothetical protein
MRFLQKPLTLVNWRKYMKNVSINVSVPEEMAPYIFSDDKEMKLIQDAMMLYPLIKNQTVSHGRVAQILGVKKRDLIDLYSSMGISYLNQSEDELLSDLHSLDNVLKNRIFA